MQKLLGYPVIKKNSTAPNKLLTAATKFGPLLLLVLVIPSSWLITYKSSKLSNDTQLHTTQNQHLVEPERERERPAIEDGKHTHVHPPSPPPQHPNHTLPLRRQTPSHPLPEIQTPPLPPRPPHLLLPLPPPPPPLSPPP